MSQDKVNLELTRAEALVLFEWLVRTDSAEAIPIEDKAEQKVFWKLEAALEKSLREPLLPDYSQLLAAARQEVRGEDEE
jgi:hypothetical protein